MPHVWPMAGWHPTSRTGSDIGVIMTGERRRRERARWSAAAVALVIGGVLAVPHVASATTPDAAPEGRLETTVPLSAAVSAADHEVNCISTGTDGKRVQLVYARRRSATDRYTATAAKMRTWAPTVDQIFQQSAAKTGGDRQVRWAVSSACTPTVLNIVVGNDVTSFAQLVTALKAQNLTPTDRKYVVAWDDTDRVESFCGLGQVMPDDKAGPTNNNETQPLGAMIAAVEPACWTGQLAAHELIHTLGAVQTSAPHATIYGHCTDGADLLCYADGSGAVIKKVCPTSQAGLFDCNNDDYFHTNPPTGNYLKTHWNPAMSGWLDPNPPPVPKYSPFASWAALVERQHRDVLGRGPTTAESSSWVAKLEGGTATRAQLVDSLRRSSENTSNVDPTARLYRAFLGRAPDASGLEFWIGRRRAGTWSLTRMADSFASSSEFTTKYGTLTNRAFVTRIYTDVLARTADPSGVNYWTGKLDRKERTRGGVMVGFSESSEYLRKQAQNTDVSVATIFLLDRVPTATESTAWVERQIAGTPHTTLLEEILSSSAYASRIART